MRRPFTGCGTALVTPFKTDGSLDEAAVSRLARRQIELGIHFLVPCGTTGEVPTLTEAEQVRVVELVVAEAAGKVPVLAGAGGYNTQEVIHSALRMKSAGANGILSVTPYYNKPTPEGLYQHYRAIAEAVQLPISSTTCRANRVQRRSGDRRPVEHHPAHRRRQGSVGQRDPDVRGCRRGAG